MWILRARRGEIPLRAPCALRWRFVMPAERYVSILFTALVLMCLTMPGHAAIPQRMNYQVMLTNDVGEPMADEVVDLTFTIYDDGSVGTDLWTEARIGTTNSIGVVSLALGSVTPIDIGFSVPLWLEVKVNGETMSPRRELVTSPYAFQAGNSSMLDGLESGEYAQAIHNHDGDYVNEGQADAVDASMIAPDVVSSVDGVSNDGGDIDLVAGSNVTITPDDGANTITISASPGGGGGDMTAVYADDGLTGTATTGDAHLDVGAGDGIDVTADAVAVDVTDFAGDGLGEDGSNNLLVNTGTGLEVSGDAVALTAEYSGGSAHDSRFVNEGQPNSVTASMVTPNMVSSVDGVSNDGGNIDLVAGSNVTITPDDGANTVTIAATAGDDGDWTILGNDIYYPRVGGVAIGSMPVATTSKLHVSDPNLSETTLVTLNAGNVSGSKKILALEINNEPSGGVFIRCERNPGHLGMFIVEDTGDVWMKGTAEMAGFTMSTNAASGSVLTSDAYGVGTWQAPVAGDDGDWTIAGDDVYRSTGNVGIGTASPASKLEVEASSGNAGWFSTSDAGPPAAALVVENSLGTGATFAALNSSPMWPATPVAVAGFGGSGARAAYFHSDGNDDAVRIEGQGTGKALHVLAIDDGYSGYFEGGAGVYVENDHNRAADFRTDYPSGGFDTHVVHAEYTYAGGNDGVAVYGESIPADGWGSGGVFLGGYSGVQGGVSPTGTGTGWYYGVMGSANHETSGIGYNYGVWGSAQDNLRNYGVAGEAWGGTNSYGVRGKAYDATMYNYGVKGYASGGTYAYGIYGSAFNGATVTLAGKFYGDVDVTGTLTKGGGSFKIDHPLDPEGKYLYHSFVESPDMMNVYNGNVVLDVGGEAWVELPGWFEALNRDYRYQLTPIGGGAPNLHIAEKISGGRFRIAGGQPGMEISWQVTGIRQDPFAEANRVRVEVDKRPDEIGKYIHPEVYGRSREEAIGYIEPDPVDPKRP